MHIYKLICRPTRRVYVGISENEPALENIDVPHNVQRDFENFGKDKFRLLKICELNNREKAEHKAQVLAEQEENPYNTYQEEPDQPEEPEYEIVEQFPEWPIEE